MRTACATHSSLITGSMPGIAASTRETLSFGSAPKAVEAPENSLERLVTWAWISMPITTSQSWRPPLISFFGFTGAFMVVRAGFAGLWQDLVPSAALSRGAGARRRPRRRAPGIAAPAGWLLRARDAIFDCSVHLRMRAGRRAVEISLPAVRGGAGWSSAGPTSRRAAKPRWPRAAPTARTGKKVGRSWPIGAGQGRPMLLRHQEARTATAKPMIAAITTLPNWLAVQPR